MLEHRCLHKTGPIDLTNMASGTWTADIRFRGERERGKGVAAPNWFADQMSRLKVRNEASHLKRLTTKLRDYTFFFRSLPSSLFKTYFWT